jgi:hypothetical protein
MSGRWLLYAVAVALGLDLLLTLALLIACQH